MYKRREEIKSRLFAWFLLMSLLIPLILTMVIIAFAMKVNYDFKDGVNLYLIICAIVICVMPVIHLIIKYLHKVREDAGSNEFESF